MVKSLQVKVAHLSLSFLFLYSALSYLPNGGTPERHDRLDKGMVIVVFKNAADPNQLPLTQKKLFSIVVNSSTLTPIQNSAVSLNG